jgi:hypothetical protein
MPCFHPPCVSKLNPPKVKGGLKGKHIDFDQKFAGYFKFPLPGGDVHFGFALIKVK